MEMVVVVVMMMVVVSDGGDDDGDGGDDNGCGDGCDDNGCGDGCDAAWQSGAQMRGVYRIRSERYEGLGRGVRIQGVTSQ